MKTLVFACCTFAALFAQATNYVAFVNVGGAVADQVLAKCVTNDLKALVCVDARIEKTDAIRVSDLIATAAKGYPRGDRQIAVYFVNSPDFPPQITVPHHLAIVNVRGLDKGADAKLHQKRIYKMTLKGLAFACGFGASMDRKCVMGIDSFDNLKGIDETYDSYSPFCMMPLESYLNKRKLMWIDPNEKYDE